MSLNNDLRGYNGLQNWYQSHGAHDLRSTRCFGVASIKEKRKFVHNLLLLVYFNTAANGIDVWFLVKRRISRHQHVLIDKETAVEILVLLDLKGRISTAGYEVSTASFILSTCMSTSIASSYISTASCMFILPMAVNTASLIFEVLSFLLMGKILAVTTVDLTKFVLRKVNTANRRSFLLSIEDVVTKKIVYQLFDGEVELFGGEHGSPVPYEGILFGAILLMIPVIPEVLIVHADPLVLHKKNVGQFQSSHLPGFPLPLLLPHPGLVDVQRLLSDPVRLSLSVDLTAPILTGRDKLLTARKRVGPIPARRLAKRLLSHHSSEHHLFTRLIFFYSPSEHSLSDIHHQTTPMLIHLHHRDLFIDHLPGLHDVVRHLDVVGLHHCLPLTPPTTSESSLGLSSERVGVKMYLLGGAIDGSKANGIIRDPKLELESSRFTFDLVPLSYESVDVVVGEN
ncbi:hypothetical protein Tco_1056646 [Tanacetum coccineum]|uniref:Uncharacterized protein n=1 Tax=Tanacetum coccineum TaxID=301880 RepID=A0ABQ5H4A7_9ASTR